MELIEAIKQSNGTPITRKKWGSTFAIIPTDEIECCICLSKGEKTVPRWNPSKEDLLADDWAVTDLNTFDVININSARIEQGLEAFRSPFADVYYVRTKK